ncbi:MAG: hypothetical protein ACQGVK_25865 [Myxococcota bacterium]
MSLRHRSSKVVGSVAAMLILTACEPVASEAPPAPARTDIPSCLSQLGDEARPSVPAREIFVLIDHTIELPEGLQRDVVKRVLAFIRPADRVTIVTFSASVAGRFTKVEFSGLLDGELEEERRYDISKTLLKRYDHCMRRQGVAAHRMIGEALKQSLSAADRSIPKTELLANLQSIARDLIKPSRAEHKVVLLVSDMLENSETLSFFGQGTIRKIDVDKELSAVRAAGMIPEVDGAAFYVVGAGLLPGPKGRSYRSDETMRRVRGFWETYLSEAGGTLEGWGQPSLLLDLR